MRRVLTGILEVYCLEDNDGKACVDAKDLQGHILYIQGNPVVLILEGTEEPELGLLIKTALPIVKEL
ncbi:hypothetical protein LCGC14_0408780 [marine sediment metagenome]|uniref:Uncharacterized protein n=1 Tax=marine sediment metagenome TaxID=412755 RepID=A0A0F9VGJ1_9ZZZZ